MTREEYNNKIKDIKTKVTNKCFKYSENEFVTIEKIIFKDYDELFESNEYEIVGYYRILSVKNNRCSKLVEQFSFKTISWINNLLEISLNEFEIKIKNCKNYKEFKMLYDIW